jgi:hypothetical protein
MGELYRRSLMKDRPILSAFPILLGNQDAPDDIAHVNDYTVEGAIVLMNKIGYILDSKLSVLETKR